MISALKFDPFSSVPLSLFPPCILNFFFQIWTQTDRQAILTLFTEIFMNGSCVHDLTVCLGPLILDVVSQLKHSILNGNLKGNFKMKQFAVALSDGLSVSRELRQ